VDERGWEDGVALYGDPDALEAIARQIEACAGGVRDRTQRLRVAVGAVAWRSTAATAFRAVAEEDAHRADHAAAELDEAAARLRRHAGLVRERVAEIRRLERTVMAWLDDQRLALVSGAGAAVDEVAELARRLPPPGDMGWLGIGVELTRRGVAL
jgi:hypothetical protein